MAAVLAVLGAMAFVRWTGVRMWVRYLGLAPILFLGLFLTTSPTSDLLNSQDLAGADIGPVDDPRTVVFLQFDEWPLQTIINREGSIDPDSTRTWPRWPAMASGTAMPRPWRTTRPTPSRPS